MSWSSSAAYSRAPNSPRASRAAATSSGRQREQRWTERLPFGNRSASYSFTIPPRDENGFKSLEQIRGKGINRVANSVAQSADHVKSFFSVLRLELAFYLGCLNLHDRLAGKQEPVCFPEPLAAGQLTLTAQGIYDVGLTLHLQNRVIGNDVNADGKSLVMITGANQGGKSTLLRSLGLAHLMMQAGMFAGARSFRAGVCHGVFTHYKREEDATMESGKLDEELSRMSAIAGQITRQSILLCNESFASTNEREGSEIARQVVSAMLRKQIKVFFVTHMYDLAHSFYTQQPGNALFLRAERLPDERRTFRLTEGDPLPTSYGEDSYRRIFGTAGPTPCRHPDQAVTPRAVPASRRRVKSCPRPPGELAANIELREGAAFPGRGRFAQQRHCARHVPVGGEASGEPVSSAAQARGYLVDVHPIPRPE